VPFNANDLDIHCSQLARLLQVATGMLINGYS
jgi:hypothetical protein